MDNDLISDGAESSAAAKTDRALSVTELTAAIRDLLEGQIGDVRVEGEISNFRRQASGHCYFTLKDAGAQLRAVMFRGSSGKLPFEPQDGIAVVASGEISVYAARGEYQIVVRSLRPKGKGSLQEQFEALKRKLAAEGLFDPERKRPLPEFPERIAIVTSPTGAALRDFLQILGRRSPRLRVQVYGAKVQGQGAAEEVAAAIKEINLRDDVDVIVVARGGGSLEDLWAFNEEPLARAIAASQIPIISGVGHEIDFTIADFVADLRAPTPSAAAELVSRADAEWREELAGQTQRLTREVQARLGDFRWRWKQVAGHYAFREPKRIVEQWYQRLDESEGRLRRGIQIAFDRKKEESKTLQARWSRVDPRDRVRMLRQNLEHRRAQLRLLSPQAVLERGYAIVFTPEKQVVRSIKTAQKEDELMVRLSDGELKIRPEKI
jgi:exodeoxyribonuclease VII large subunit